MSSVIPLQIHPWPPSAAQMDAIKEAKQSLNLELKVLPTPAAPGLHARVLALGSLPPWVCDVALVKDPTNMESIAGALEWILTAPPEDDRGFMVVDYLEAVFGLGVKELPTPECMCECGRKRAVRGGEPLEKRCAPCHDAGCHLMEGLCIGE